MESKHRETFYGFFMDQKTTNGPEQHLGGAPRGAQPTRAQCKEGVREATEVGTTHLGAPGGPGTPWWVVFPSGHPSGASLAQCWSSGP